MPESPPAAEARHADSPRPTSRWRRRLRRCGTLVRRQRREPQPSAGAAVVRRGLDGRMDAHRRPLRGGVPRRRADSGRARGVRAHGPGRGAVAVRHGARRPFPPRSSAALDVRAPCRRARRLRDGGGHRRPGVARLRARRGRDGRLRGLPPGSFGPAAVALPDAVGAHQRQRRARPGRLAEHADRPRSRGHAAGGRRPGDGARRRRRARRSPPGSLLTGLSYDAPPSASGGCRAPLARRGDRAGSARCDAIRTSSCSCG